MCEYMHMKDYFTVYCTMCAYLHDIGKQFIPAAILQKTSVLTPEEFEIMKTHTTIGYQICMKDPKLRPYAAGPIYHHEGLNGSGYPKGLEKKDIPLEGQIIRVADEFDAITSKRQYKTHIGVCDTLKILVSETKPNKKNHEKYGKVNPTAVKALIKVIIDDTAYELYNLGLYVDYLKKEQSRLKQIQIYENKKNKATRKNDIEYYTAGMFQLFAPGETVENYKTVLEEYKTAYNVRSQEMANLTAELKEIKKLRV